MMVWILALALLGVSAAPVAQLMTFFPDPAIYVMNITTGEYSVVPMPFIGNPVYARRLNSCRTFVMESEIIVVPQPYNVSYTVVDVCQRVVVSRINASLSMFAQPGFTVYDSVSGLYLMPFRGYNWVRYCPVNATSGTFSGNCSETFDNPDGGEVTAFALTLNAVGRMLYFLVGSETDERLVTYDLSNNYYIHSPLVKDNSFAGPMSFGGNRVLLWDNAAIWEITPHTGIAVKFVNLPKGWYEAYTFTYVGGPEYVGELGCTSTYCAPLLLDPTAGTFVPPPPKGVSGSLNVASIAANL